MTTTTTTTSAARTTREERAALRAPLPESYRSLPQAEVDALWRSGSKIEQKRLGRAGLLPSWLKMSPNRARARRLPDESATIRAIHDVLWVPPDAEWSADTLDEIGRLVPQSRGDIVKLNAGDIVAADARLLEANDLPVRESSLTGESLPVEETASDLPRGKHGVADASNSVFLGTAVQTGMGTAVIVCTGRDTAFGEITQRLAMRPPETEFGRGIRHFGLMITRVIMLLVLFVLLVNIILARPLLESFLFSVALAVGLTPEMMAMIITVTLAQGAPRLARKKVLVTRLVRGNTNVGGLVGYNYQSKIANCYSVSSIVKPSGNFTYIGGLVGYNESWGSITNSYSCGLISGTGSSVGGFVG